MARSVLPPWSVNWIMILGVLAGQTRAIPRFARENLLHDFAPRPPPRGIV
jgi:hypothetical protein